MQNSKGKIIVLGLALSIIGSSYTVIQAMETTVGLETTGGAAMQQTAQDKAKLALMRCLNSMAKDKSLQSILKQAGHQLPNLNTIISEVKRAKTTEDYYKSLGKIIAPIEHYIDDIQVNAPQAPWWLGYGIIGKNWVEVIDSSKNELEEFSIMQDPDMRTLRYLLDNQIWPVSDDYSYVLTKATDFLMLVRIKMVIDFPGKEIDKYRNLFLALLQEKGVALRVGMLKVCNQVMIDLSKIGFDLKGSTAKFHNFLAETSAMIERTGNTLLIYSKYEQLSVVYRRFEQTMRGRLGLSPLDED